MVASLTPLAALAAILCGFFLLCVTLPLLPVDPCFVCDSVDPSGDEIYGTRFTLIYVRVD